MTMDKYRVCVAQTTSYKEGKEYNLKRAGEMIKEAAGNGASLIAFPEMYLTGYTAGRRIFDLCEAANGHSFDVMAGYAAENRIHVAYGYPEYRSDDNTIVYNSINLISDEGDLIGTYAKSHLFGGEKVNFTPGTEFNVFDTKLGKVGLLICYDLEFPEPARRLGCRGADVIIAIAANMYPCVDLHKKFAMIRAMENSAYVVYANYTGSDNRYDYVGQSGLYAPDGSIEFGSSETAEELIYADVDFAALKQMDPNAEYLRFITDEEREYYLR